MTSRIEAIDVEPGHIVVLKGEPRLITESHVHLKRGDGIPDGYVRLCWNGGSALRLADSFLLTGANNAR